VLAAANPVYGQYDKRRRIQENIGLPDSLLSRFDLLFVVLDQLDPAKDRRIADHVIRGHKYRPHGQGLLNGGRVDSDDDFDGEDTDDEFEPSSSNRSGKNSVWQRPYENFTKDRFDEDDEPFENVLQQDFLRKYLHFSKTRMKPKLTDEAREEIAVRYSEMRSRQDSRTLPITARSLETIIRLSSAHAKARLSPIVEADPDCKVAIDILGFALYHENNYTISEKPVESDNENSDEIEIDRRKRKRLNMEEGILSEEERMRRIKEKIWDEMSKEGDGQLPVDNACLDIKDRKSVVKALEQMEADGRVMIGEGMIFQI